MHDSVTYSVRDSNTVIRLFDIFRDEKLAPLQRNSVKALISTNHSRRVLGISVQFTELLKL